MATNKENVFVGVSGKFMKLDPEAQVIDSADSELTGVDYGYLSEDGIEIATDKSTDNRRAWQNGDVVRVLTEDASTTFSFTLIEDTIDTRELYHGSREVDGKTEWNPTNSVRGRFALLVVDPKASGGRTYRKLYVFDGEVSSVEPITIANTELIGYGITIQTLGTTVVYTSTEAVEEGGDPEV